MVVLFEKIRRQSAARVRDARPVKPRSSPLRFYLSLIVAVAVILGVLFWYTSARILDQPVEIAYGPAEAGFAGSLGPLLGAEFTGGNRVEILLNGAQMFPAMLKAIDEAKTSITFETYIWASGRVSDEFVRAIERRARAGVAVKIIVDGMGTLKFAAEDQERLRRAGVRLLKYGREHWYQIKPNINHRTHRKGLVVDGRIGFTGGMCVDDHWRGNAESGEVWRETAVQVEGPVVRQMQASFAANWLQTTGELIVGTAYFPVLRSVGDTVAQCYKSGPRENPESARISYLMAIAAARKSIRIEHAYFVPDDLATEMILAARRRGVTVEVIIPAVNDSRFGRAASRSRWGVLLEAGVKFHRYEPAMLHAKLMIVDDVFVTIGSVNFDNRSFAINDEMNVNLLDPAVARRFVRTFEADLRNSKPLTREAFEGRSRAIKVIDWFCGMFRSQL